MSVMCDKVINLATRQIGYKETGDNQTKYSRWFDTTAWQWFNTKKQGAEWCAIFICWLFAQNETLGKDRAYTFLGCPKNKNDNLAAGVPYLWGYLTKQGWKIDKKGGLKGDIIFFNSKCSHVGIIEKVDDKKYYTIEGNKSNQVKRCSYSRGSSAIYGICRPDWAKVEPKPEPTPTPTPTPAPTPKPTPTTQKYKVKTNTGAPLALRSAPKTKAVCLAWIPNKTVVTVSGFVTGEKVGGCDRWARVTYNGKNGYSLSKYLVKS